MISTRKMEPQIFVEGLPSRKTLEDGELALTYLQMNVVKDWHTMV